MKFIKNLILKFSKKLLLVFLTLTLGFATNNVFGGPFTEGTKEDIRINAFMVEIWNKLDFMPHKYHEDTKVTEVFGKNDLVKEYTNEIDDKTYLGRNKIEISENLIDAVTNILDRYFAFNKQVYKKAYSIEQLSLQNCSGDPISKMFATIKDSEQEQTLKDKIDRCVKFLNDVLNSEINESENQKFAQDSQKSLNGNITIQSLIVQNAPGAHVNIATRAGVSLNSVAQNISAHSKLKSFLTVALPVLMILELFYLFMTYQTTENYHFLASPSVQMLCTGISGVSGGISTCFANGRKRENPTEGKQAENKKRNGVNDGTSSSSSSSNSSSSNDEKSKIEEID